MWILTLYIDIVDITIPITILYISKCSEITRCVCICVFYVYMIKINITKEKTLIAYHVDDLLQSDAKPHLQWFTLIRDRSLQGVVICQQVIQ